MMQDEDEGDARPPQSSSSSSSSPSFSSLSAAQHYEPSSTAAAAVSGTAAATGARREMAASERPRQRTAESPSSCRSPSSTPSDMLPPSSPLSLPVDNFDARGGNGGRRRRDDLHHSLSDTDQAHHHRHQNHHFHRHLIINPSASPLNPTSLPVSSATAAAARHHHQQQQQHPYQHQHQHHRHHHHPTTLHIRPAVSPQTLSLSSSPTTAQPLYVSHGSAAMRAFNGIATNAAAAGGGPSYPNQSFQLFPPDTRPKPPPQPPRLFHTRSCPQGSSSCVVGPLPPPPSAVRRQVSVPVAQREIQQSRHAVQRSTSRTQTIKNYIRKSTATFFGVDDVSEEDCRRRWAERRRRMASKNYGALKDGYECRGLNEIGEAQGSMTPGTGMAPSFGDTPDSAVVGPGRSWPQQMSRISDLDSTAATTPTSSGFRLRPMPSSALHHRRKESVVRLTWDGIAYIASTVARRRQRSAVGQPPNCPQVHLSSQNFRFSVDESVFEDSPDIYSSQPETSQPSPGIDSVTEDVFYDRITPSSPVSTPHLPPEYSISPPSSIVQPQPYSLSSARLSSDEGVSTGWRRSVPVPDVPEQDELSVGMRRMWKRITDQLFDNSDRRQYGMGVVGRYLKRSFRKDRITSEVKEQLEDMDDHRPFFTYWITIVQILITIISLTVYGFGPIGFEHTQRSGLVLVTSLSLQQIDYLEPDNFWIGPRAADLVHLGAKFAPCMRRDRNVLKAITTDRSQERNTACCIRNDNSGCVQTSRDECSTTISTWKKWHSNYTGPGGRISGSVCGQDPSYCSDPPSAPPYNWPDDITMWPICRKKVRSDLSRAAHEHMACEVIGHPCCIGILGECHITTREYCDFVKGFFHEEAALCSQVSCLDDICGMIPFYNPEVPDQFYRLWTSLFLHAGLIHLSVTVMVQYFFMRDLEKLTGALRIGLIYIVSGVAGNLASAIFVPYRAEVGPAGSQFGLLACLMVEVIHSWPMLKRPGKALAKLLVIAAALFVLGLLPWVDNYAHLFGFAFGFMLSYALLPFVSFGVYDRRKKVSLIWICLATVVGLFATLTMLFYVSPIYECEFCKYLTCLPLTPNFCATQDINITTRRHL